MRTARVWGAAAPLAVLLAAAPALAQKLELKLAHVGEIGANYDLVAQEYIRRVHGKLGDKVSIGHFAASQLGSDRDLLQKLKLNQVTFFIPSSLMSSVAPEFGVFDMPYIIRDRAHMRRVIDNLHDKVLNPAARAKGVRLISTWENGFRHITNNVRPIVKPEDLKGIKLRVPQGEWRVRMFQSYGANPTPMGFGEVFTALKTGVMDGQENPYIQIWAAKFQEVQKYLSQSAHVFSPAWLAVSEEHFAKLPPDVQKVLADTAKEVEDYAFDLSDKLEDELLAKIKASGIQINQVDKAAFIAASKSIYQEYTKAVPTAAALIQQIEALAQ